MKAKSLLVGCQYNVAAFFGLFLLLLINPFPSLAQTSSPHLSLSPTVKEVNAGVNFNVTVSVDTGGQQVNGVDAVVQYDSSLLEVVSVSEGTFFPTITTITTTLGKVEIYGVADTGSPKTGTGTMATITFKGKASGTAAVNFICQSGSTNDSNINSASDTDIIACASNVNASYVITGQSGTTTQTTPTATTSAEDLPQTGFLEPTALIIGGGIILMILGLAFIF
ncbi:MAG: cohesin domain-containing protein [Candidatus Shapirobacteria bacterium]|nr:cohesin domain-containing protein [Candidatus Shapirobacteria bacterium]MDD5073896.1 cohesin domain-containing protein [Candidatus Shapirobacteria bacterium]MDD5481490.1 cohesin domain-containing protein [Candidatus Shapirobacteria bacterium]